MEKNLKKLWDPATVKTDCRWFRGHVPCLPHKKEGVVCMDCLHYEKLGQRLLIIKLGAAGDVIRTTPLLRRIRKDHPNAEIVWLTYFPDLVPKDYVNKVLLFELKNLVWLETQAFDWLINLDKDDEAIAVAAKVKAKKISGFLMGTYGKCKPARDAATVRKWMTGIWDDLNKANTKSYMQEIFEICGYTFNDEPYLLPKQAQREWEGIDKSKIVVGLNTGCGARWTTRLWGEKNWTMLAQQLKAANYEVVLLGGPQEDEQNRRIAQSAGVKYPGYFDLDVFIDLMDQCRVIVSQVTMAMHIAIGLGKHLVLMNNIFNRHEFFLYEKGTVVEPDLKCLGCFKQRFDENCPVDNCMDLIKPERVALAVGKTPV
jgi:heptosyltransferase-2